MTRVLTVVGAAVAAVVLSACGGSPESASAPSSSVAARPSSRVVVVSEAPTGAPACWSMAVSTWAADYMEVQADIPAALAVLDALPDPNRGCDEADVADLVRAHDLAATIRR